MADPDKRKRSIGQFPRLPLSKVLEIPQTVYDLGHGYRVRRLEVFDRLGKKPTSGNSKMLLTVSTPGDNGYGFTTGSYVAEYLELTELGERLVTTSNDRDKYNAIYDALFSNNIFSGFIHTFKDRPIPTDSVAIDYLTNEHNLGKEDAKICLDVFRSNIDDYKLTQNLSGRDIIISREVAIRQFGEPEEEQMQDLSEIPTEDEQIVDETPLRAPIPSFKPSPDKNINPEFHFNIQIHLPADASPEQYDAIFKSIGKHLLGKQEDN